MTPLEVNSNQRVNATEMAFPELFYGQAQQYPCAFNLVVATDRGRETGVVSPGPTVQGAPKLVQVRSGSSFTSQSSFSKEFVLLYC